MRRTAKTLAILVALALVVSPLAAGDQAQITIPHNVRVTVLTLALKQNDTVSFSWTANASITFQVNDLSGNNYVSQVGQTGNGNWNVPSDNSYVFNFRNTSDLPVSVQWTINHTTPVSVTTSYLLVGVALFLLVATTLIWTRTKKHPSPKTQH